MSVTVRWADLSAEARARLGKAGGLVPERTKNKIAVALRAKQQELARESFGRMLERAKLPAPLHEFHFHPEREWRFDYAWPSVKIALEVEGGVWTQGRHTRGAGFLADMQKYNAAAVLGWRVIRCTPDALTARSTERTLKAVLFPSDSPSSRAAR